MAKLTALQLARYIVRYAQEKGEPITNLKLQKLLYYAQAWHLAFFDKVLFQDPLQAWIHGPVAPPVYGAFKGFGYNPIPIHPRKVELSSKSAGLVDDVLLTYLSFDAFTLECMTHREKPWLEARGSLPLDEPCKNEISTSTMKEYFKQVLKEAEREN